MKRLLIFVLMLCAIPAFSQSPAGGYGPSIGANASGGSGSWATVLDAVTYGVKANWKEFYGTNVTIAVTSGSASVTCTGCFTSTAANGGMTITATNAGGTIASDTNYLTSVGLFPAGTGILSVQSANAATMTANATGSCSGSTGPSCIFAFGTNDDAAWNALNTAFQAVNTCPAVIAPAGITNWDTVNKFNTAPLSCTPAVQGNTATLTNSGPMFRGQGGPSGTKIVLTPTYLAAVVAGTCAASCSFNIPNMIVKDAGWTGYGQSNAGQTTVAKLFGNGTGSYYENVSLSGFMGGDTSVNNFGASVNYASAINFKVDGFGGNAVVCASYCWVKGNSYALDSFRFNFTCGGYCFSEVGLGTGATFVAGGADYVCTSGSHCYSQGDNIQYENATNPHQIYQNQGGTLYINGMHMLAATTSTTGLYAPSANSVFHIRDSEITGGATANAILVAGGSTVQFYDECGNTITGPVTFSTALFVPCPQTAYTVTVPQVGATGTGACATITTQTGNILTGSLKCTGTTGASTIVLTPGITAQNGWNCKNSQDITTVANTFVQTAIATGTCTLTGTVNANDVVEFSLAQF